MGQPVQEGEMLAGKYKVERVLGQGGMGVVVAAMHQQLEQRVALKFLLPEGASNGESVARFLREARAAVRLRSEHVAKVLDVGTLDTGAPYIVMEYLEGRDLHSLLEEQGKLPPDEAVDHLLQACEAIAEAHAAGIVHRDLKPANLFLTQRSDGSLCVKVLDFGISKMASDQSSMSMTKTSTVLGTPFYMSPEQLRSSRAVDPRSDIWALGMILYEMVTGRVAYDRETLPELCAAILVDPVQPPKELCPGLPEEMNRVICTCLEKDPAARFQNLSELARALAPFSPDGEAIASSIARILGIERSGNYPALAGRRSALPRASLPDVATLAADAASLPDAPRLSVPTPPAPTPSAPTPSGAAASQPARPRAVAPEPAVAETARRPLLLGGVAAAAVVALLGFGALRSRAGEPPAPSPSATLAAATDAPSAPASQPAAPATAPAASSAPATPATAAVHASATKPPAALPRKTPPPVKGGPAGGMIDFGERK